METVGFWKGLFEALPPELLCMIIVILALLKFLGSSLKSNKELSGDIKSMGKTMERLTTLVGVLVDRRAP